MCKQHQGLTRLGKNGPVWNGKVNFVKEALNLPLRWRTKRLAFVGSMSDLFYEGVSPVVRGQMVGIMAAAWTHRFLVLTKRVEELLAFSKGLCHYQHDDRKLRPRDGWPSNVALIASAEDQRHYDIRVQKLVHKTPCMVSQRGMSLEPLLGPIRLGATGRIHLSWVVVGGESGPGARPMKLDWALDLIKECRDADVPVYFKQTGTVLAREMGLSSRAGEDPGEWPEELCIQEEMRWEEVTE